MTAANEKLSALRALVTKRRSIAAGSTLGGYSRDYKKIGDFHSGAYDFDDHVVPYSKSAFNLDADVMILAQDWASEDFLSKPFNAEQAALGHDPSLHTNKRLFHLLDKFFKLAFADTYATDAFVFAKPGNMGAPISSKDFKLSTLEYAVPQIAIINPKLLICVGGQPFNALRSISKLQHMKLDTPFAEQSFTMGSSLVVGVYHVGGRGTSNLGGKDAQENQWERLADFYSEYKDNF